MSEPTPKHYATQSLSGGWPSINLGDLLEPDGLSYGVVQPGVNDPHGVPILRVKNLRNGRIIFEDILYVQKDIDHLHRRTRLQGGEVLLSLVGSVGEAVVAPTSIAGWNVARAIGVIRTRSEVSSLWIQLCLGSDLVQHRIRSWQNETVQATLNLSDVRRLPILMPPACVREAIVDLIGSLNDKISINEQIIASCTRLAATYLERLLSDFNLADGWHEVRLSAIAHINATKSEPVEDGQLRYIDIAAVSPGHVEWPEATSWDSAPSRARRGVRVGDVIWSTVRPNRQSHALILDRDPMLVASTGFAVLTPQKVGPAYLYGIVTTDGFVAYLESVAEGSAYPTVRADRFGDARVPLPPNDSLVRFESQVFPLRQRAHAAEVESRALASLRDTLLPKLLSGEIRIKDAERLVSDAV